jgi:hypothetical protein
LLRRLLKLRLPPQRKQRQSNISIEISIRWGVVSNNAPFLLFSK